MKYSKEFENFLVQTDMIERRDIAKLLLGIANNNWSQIIKAIYGDDNS